MDAEYEALLDEIRREFPRFRLVRKDQSRFQRMIDRALRVVTFGAQSSYLDMYQTTIGHTVYVTPDWDERPADQRVVTLRHERVHLRQFRRWTVPGMAFLYLLVPFPVGIAYFRMRFEREAYEETLRSASRVWGKEHVLDPAYKEYVISQFTSGSYGWMWPFRRALERWYDSFVGAL